jgi:hypothetical protein
MFIVRANLDRVYWAAGERDKAREVFRIAYSDLGRTKGDPRGAPLDEPLKKSSLFMEGRYRGLSEPLREALARYLQFLRNAERNEAAGLLETRIRQIDEIAREPSGPSGCVALRAEAPMGCLLEIE